MKKYKVKVGSHIQDGKLYKAGKSVLSEKPLELLFPSKFELATVPAPVPESAPVKSSVPASAVPPAGAAGETTKLRPRRPAV